MGVVFVAFTLDDKKIEQLHQDPPLIWRAYEPNNKTFYLSAIGANNQPGLIARLFGAKKIKVPNPLPSFQFSKHEKQEIDLDKSWDGINFCLKQLLPPTSLNIFESGTEVGDLEVGYSRATTFTSQEVTELNQLYQSINEQQLVDTLQPQKMHSIYPTQFWQEKTPDLEEYVREHFIELKQFLQNASNHSMGICVIYT